MVWKRGQSGNPAGRPKGVRDKRTELRRMIDPHARDLIEKLVSLGLKGNPAALRILAERLLPKPRDEFVRIPDLPADPGEQAEAILREVTEGRITPGEGNELLRILSAKCQIAEFATLSDRLSKLEAMLVAHPSC